MTPLISVVIPTFNRPQLLEACLGKLLDQTLAPCEYEIIVADDADSATTRDQVVKLSESTPVRLRYIAVTGPHGPAAARNRGWRAAAADAIAFTDDDCLPDRDWLRSGLAMLDLDADAVWGRIIMPLPEQPTDYERDAANLAEAEFVTANCFCRKDWLKRVNGFDECFRCAWREDSDFFFSLLERGANVRHESDAIVIHPIRRAPWGVSVKQQRKVFFDALLYRKHPDLFRRKIRPTPPWHYYVIVLAVLVVVAASLLDAPRVAVLAALIWAALTARFIYVRLRDTRKNFSHIAEMFVTSILIPPLALFWQWAGAWRFRAFYL